MDAWVLRRGLPSLWVLGGAKHVDTQAREKCDLERWPYAELFALWRWLHKAAGMQRNQDMVAVVATGGPGSAFLGFPCPKSRGTWKCLQLARGAGLETFVCRALLGGGV
jgi:hypothetical protein